MIPALPSTRVGVFVDASYLSTSGGHGMRYDVLREFVLREGGAAAHFFVYVTYDEDRAREDVSYRRGQESFHSVLRDFGFKVCRKKMRGSEEEPRGRVARSPVDVLLTVDLLQQAGALDRVCLVAGEGDLVQAVRAIQARGVRVEVLGFDHVAADLREEADAYHSGYLIPNLLPIPDQPEREAWGTLGGRVRGVCYNHSGKGYGFLRYLKKLSPNLWITDSRHADSPYATVFFHDSQLPENVVYTQLPSRNLIFEFELVESDKFEGDLQAVDLYLVSGTPGRSRGSDVNERGGVRRTENGDEFSDEDDSEEVNPGTGEPRVSTAAHLPTTYGRRPTYEP